MRKYFITILLVFCAITSFAQTHHARHHHRTRVHHKRHHRHHKSHPHKKRTHKKLAHNTHAHKKRHRVKLEVPTIHGPLIHKKPPVIHKIIEPEMIGDRDVVIMIDPGHGGKDPGAHGPHGSLEKNVVLAISKALKKYIDMHYGFRAYLTRHGDYYLTLRQRIRRARKYKPDMFVAIHADAYWKRSSHGASVYALSPRGATSEAARWLAHRENVSELMGGAHLNNKDRMLQSVLINLSQNYTISVSLHIGQVLLHNLSHFADLHHGKVEQAAFVVLKSPDIPSLLVETGFISNLHEEHRLTSSYYQKRLARGIGQGIIAYFKKHPPKGTRIANP